MADTVATRTILDGERKYIIDIHNTSDGNGEAGVTKVDVSALANSQKFAFSGSRARLTAWRSNSFGMPTRMSRHGASLKTGRTLTWISGRLAV